MQPFDKMMFKVLPHTISWMGRWQRRYTEGTWGVGFDSLYHFIRVMPFSFDLGGDAKSRDGPRPRAGERQKTVIESAPQSAG